GGGFRIALRQQFVYHWGILEVSHDRQRETFSPRARPHGFETADVGAKQDGAAAFTCDSLEVFVAGQRKPERTCLALQQEEPIRSYLGEAYEVLVHLPTPGGALVHCRQPCLRSGHDLW